MSAKARQRRNRIRRAAVGLRIGRTGFGGAARVARDLRHLAYLIKLGQPRGGAAALRARARDLRESAWARANRPGSEASSDRVKPGHDGAPDLLLAPVPRAPGAFPTEICGIDLSF